MSTNIPLDIQVEIIKRLLHTKSLIRFRSVSKQWMSLIDSSEFITDHSVNQAQPHRLLIGYTIDSEYYYVSIVDDDSFPQPKAPIYSPTLIRIMIAGSLRGSSHGLVCSYGLYCVGKDRMMLMVIWNPSIRKSVGIELPTDDSIVVGLYAHDSIRNPSIRKSAEGFTLSSRAWRSVSWNLPYKTLTFYYPQAVVDGVIHWIAYDWGTKYYRIISFDLTREEFGEIELIDSFASRWKYPGIYKLNGPLVVLDYPEYDAGKHVLDVWMMLKNGAPKSSFTKLFSITTEWRHYNIKGFQKNGQPILEFFKTCYYEKELEVYEPRLQSISGFGIYGRAFKMTSYTESLLLLNNSDFIIRRKVVVL
ncbi:putative F-box protein At1g47790 [Bidens hawaiensis]|uniref:putative F-box protein At1g47790 n=1 Tax=Bidens hawaiensis TaxID=980011 RepID=UPI00404ACBDA